jgi:hypothetical protein
MLPLSRIVHIPLVVSTMEAAKAMLPSSGAFAVVADRQTRDCFGLADSRERGFNVTIAMPSSAVTLPVLPVFHLMAGVVARDTIIKISPELEPLRLAWPNYIQLNGVTHGTVSVTSSGTHVLVDICMNQPASFAFRRKSSAVEPVKFASEMWSELSRLLAVPEEAQTSARQTNALRDRVVSSFKLAMDWDAEVVARDGSGAPRRLRPLTEWGQLVVQPVSSSSEETLIRESAI